MSDLSDYEIEQRDVAIAAMQGLLAGNPRMKPDVAAEKAVEYAKALQEALMWSRTVRISQARQQADKAQKAYEAKMKAEREAREMEERGPF